MSVARQKDTQTKFRTVAPEQQGGHGVARPIKGNHVDVIRHAGEIIDRTYKEALKELSKV